MMLSAASLLTFGHTLFAEAVLTMGLLGLSCAALFWLARRASGSTAIAVAIALLQIAMAPRLYNYPKLLAYAVAIPVCWWYIDRPTRRSLALMALSIAFGFLLRHDHGIYIFVAGAASVVVAHDRTLRRAATETVLLAAMTTAALSPYLIWMQAHGGVVHYFRAFGSFIQAELPHTTLQRPRFSFDWSMPAVVRVERPPQLPHVNVRWAAAVTDRTREEDERRHGLRLFDVRPSGVRTYLLTDWSRQRLQAIVTEPAIADTQGIDRSLFVINDPAYARQPTAIERLGAAATRYRVLPGVLRAENAAPFLYYLMWGLPLAAMIALLRRAEAPSPERWTRGAEKMAIVVLLAVLIDRGFLRGSLTSRLADVTEVTGVLAAWLVAVMINASRRPLRLLGIAATCVLLLLTILSTQAIEQVSAQLRQAGAFSGVSGVRHRASEVYALLSTDPPVAAFGDDPGITRVARYVNACTRPTDRVLAVGYLQELYFLSARGFAGGQVWIRPHYFTGSEDQRTVIEGIAAHPVPIVFEPPEPVYTADYAASFPALDAFLRSRYEDRGTFDFGRDVRLRVLVRRDLQPTAHSAFQDLPCFS
ncbi:MAG: hypothetical protein DMF88_08840 [Acidobacteria bacterium]|nr:MAG: hypothetical protein DMF88_08840 [Acidobacteriota bacterium]